MTPCRGRAARALRQCLLLAARLARRRRLRRGTSYSSLLALGPIPQLNLRSKEKPMRFSLLCLPLLIALAFLIGRATSPVAAASAQNGGPHLHGPNRRTPFEFLRPLPVASRVRKLVRQASGAPIFRWRQRDTPSFSTRTISSSTEMAIPTTQSSPPEVGRRTRRSGAITATESPPRACPPGGRTQGRAQ
jgi:hypothetical protein